MLKLHWRSPVRVSRFTMIVSTAGSLKPEHKIRRKANLNRRVRCGSPRLLGVETFEIEPKH